MVTIIIDGCHIVTIINHGYYNLIGTISGSADIMVDGMVTTLHRPLPYNLYGTLLRGIIPTSFYLNPPKNEAIQKKQQTTDETSLGYT
jgi:hypothetical protein